MKTIKETIIACLKSASTDLSPSTVRLYEQGIKRFVTFLDKNDVNVFDNASALTMEHFRKFPAWLGEEKFLPQTRKAYLSGVRYYLVWLVLESIIDPAPNELEKFKKAIARSTGRRSSRLPKTPSPEIIAAMLDAAKNSKARTPIFERNIAIVLMLTTSGCRVAELVGMNVQDINTDNHYAVVIGKGDKEAHIYFSPETSLAMKRYWRARGNQDETLAAFFRHDSAANKLPKESRRLTTTGARYVIGKISGDAGIDGNISPHAFRHAFAVRVLRQTGRLEITQDLMRHSSPNTTRRYAKIASKELQEAHQSVYGDSDESSDSTSAVGNSSSTE